MSITTELREFVDGLACHKVTRDLLREIADRIDEELANYVELPKGADGETIHLQDRMSWDNGTFNVHELKLDADGWTTWDELHGYTVRADQCRHVQPDTWMSILANAYNGEFRSFDELVERCKKLAGEAE